jgi:hypothetical protein
MTKARVKTIKAEDVRIGERIRVEGKELIVYVLRLYADSMVIHPKKDAGAGLYDGQEFVVRRDADVELLGLRKRKLAGMVHFNTFAAEGVMTVRENFRGRLGSERCGASTGKLHAFAKSPELITCDKCAEIARLEKLRRIGPR